MAQSYNKEIDLYSRDITIHYQCQASPCILPLDHDNLQNFMLFVCHDKAAPTTTPLATYQNSLQENHVMKAPDNFQMRHQLLHLEY